MKHRPDDGYENATHQPACRRKDSHNSPITPVIRTPLCPTNSSSTSCSAANSCVRNSDQFVDPSKLHIVGIFPSYEDAYKAWRGATGQTIDDAHTRYYIVHLHRFLDPAAGDHKH
ncbi:DUF4170 domain-containing protein [Azospirillum melinis]|uniref:DUF4170 domain-containing protein n=1 Tax=Azospirillum melinis TaxID=328839 RepID=UPI0037568D9F